MKILEFYEVDEEINRQSLEGPKKFAFYVFNPDGSGTLFCWHDEIDEALIWLTYLTSAMYFFYEEEMKDRKDFLAKALPRAINASKKIIIFEDFVDEWGVELWFELLDHDVFVDFGLLFSAVSADQ